MSVCRAKAGILTVHDVPLYLPQSAFRSDVTFNEGHKICPSIKKQDFIHLSRVQKYAAFCIFSLDLEHPLTFKMNLKENRKGRVRDEVHKTW